jgi:hypothetical protein
LVQRSELAVAAALLIARFHTLRIGFDGSDVNAPGTTLPKGMEHGGCSQFARHGYFNPGRFKFYKVDDWEHISLSPG